MLTTDTLHLAAQHGSNLLWRGIREWKAVSVSVLACFIAVWQAWIAKRAARDATRSAAKADARAEEANRHRQEACRIQGEIKEDTQAIRSTGEKESERRLEEDHVIHSQLVERVERLVGKLKSIKDEHMQSIGDIRDSVLTIRDLVSERWPLFLERYRLPFDDAVSDILKLEVRSPYMSDGIGESGHPSYQPELTKRNKAIDAVIEKLTKFQKEHEARGATGAPVGP